MDRRRRNFLSGLAPLAAGWLALRPLAAQPQAPQPRLPEPPSIRDVAPDPPKPDPRDRLKHDRKQVREQAGQLFELAGEIFDEVEKTDSAEILPLGLIKKIEDVEKLAKRMKSLLKGF